MFSFLLLTGGACLLIKYLYPQENIYGFECFFLFFILILYNFIKKDRFALKEVYAHYPHGIIFFDQKGKGFWPNLSFYNLFQLPPQIDLNLNCFDTLLHNDSSWSSLERLKEYSRTHKESIEILEFHLRKSIVRLRITIKKISNQKVIWFIEPIQNSSQLQNILPEHKVLSEVLMIFPYPAIIILNNRTISYTNKAFNAWLGYEQNQLCRKLLSQYLDQVPASWERAKGTKLQFKDIQGTFRPINLLHSIPFSGQNLTCLIFQMEQENSLSHNDSPLIKKILDLFPVPALLLDPSGLIRTSNHLFQELLPEILILNRPFLNWIQKKQQESFIIFLHNLRQKKIQSQPFLTELPQDPEKEIGIYARYLHDTLPALQDCFLLWIEDITDLKKNEIQTLEAQKLQALGQLAVGITHDFNNLLTAMVGFCDLLLQRHSAKDQSFIDIMQIKQNANRATNLVRQLLLFARQSPPHAQIINIRDCLQDISLLLRRLIGPKIALKFEYEPEEALIYFDQGQVEQIIMNLVINGRDAMHSGGILTIKTRIVSLKEPLVLHHNTLLPQDYVVIDVRDTGSGIEAKNLERIFDPFFSTKDPGQGTGLGLATVIQILHKISGGVYIKTQLQIGTTFSIYLPRYIRRKKDLPIASPILSPTTPQDFSGCAKILLVEDEDPVRLFASRALRSKGYNVLEARDGHKALELLDKNPGIDLLITDVIMPGIDGPTLVKCTSAINTTMKILFVSGYPEDQLSAKLSPSLQLLYFLSKPFSLNELVQKVHAILEKK